MSEEKTTPDHLAAVRELLAKHKLVEDLVHRQEMPRQELVEDVVHKQHLAGLRSLLERIPLTEIARIIEALEPDDRLLVWYEVREERGEAILEILTDEVRQDLICDSHLRNEKTSVTAFELRNGRLSQINVRYGTRLR